MPGKLRKSRSRNNNNNRPASRQSRKRKTPKGKGKARKTTRRRVKRGGMFGLGGPSKEKKAAVEVFMLVVILHFLFKMGMTKIIRYWSTTETKMIEINLEEYSGEDLGDLGSLFDSENIAEFTQNFKVYHVINISVVMKNIDIVKTLQYYLKSKQTVDIKAELEKIREHDRAGARDQLLKAATTKARETGEEICRGYFNLLEEAFKFALQFFQKDGNNSITFIDGINRFSMKEQLITMLDSAGGENAGGINKFDKIMTTHYKGYNKFFSAINDEAIRKEICVLIT